MSVSLDSAGWTVITPAATDHVIYCSSSTGSDSNDGLSQQKPVKSLAVAESKLRSHTGDQLLLKAGDTWQGSFGYWTLSGKSAQEPIVIGSYGTGARPTIATGTTSGITTGKTSIPEVDYLAIVGVRFWANGRDPSATSKPAASSNPTGIALLAKSNDILIENCQIQDYSVDVNLFDYFGRLANISLRRNVIIDAYATVGHSQGLYAMGVDGLTLDGNLFDHNGYNTSVPGAVATIYNQDAYLNSDDTACVIENNIFSRAAGFGLQDRPGGIVKNNLFLNDPIGMSFGLVNGATSTPGGVTGSITGNVFIGGGSIGSTVEGQAIQIGNIKPGAGAVIANNIFTQSVANSMPAIALTSGIAQPNPQQSVGINDLKIQSNTFYDLTGGIDIEHATPGGTGLTAFNRVSFTNNQFENITGQTFHQHDPIYTTQETWTGNSYFNTGMWGIAGATVAPKGTVLTKAFAFAAPTRSVATYDKTLGGNGTVDDFLNRARLESKQNWNVAYEGSTVAAYITAGFAIT